MTDFTVSLSEWLVYLVHKNVPTNLMATGLINWVSYWLNYMYVLRSTLSREWILFSARNLAFDEHTDACSFNLNPHNLPIAPVGLMFVTSSKSTAFIYDPNWAKLHSCILVPQVVSIYVCAYSKFLHLSCLSSFNLCRLIL